MWFYSHYLNGNIFHCHTPVPVKQQLATTMTWPIVADPTGTHQNIHTMKGGMLP